MKGRSEWLLCPVCHKKTRTKIYENTTLNNFPLFCPKCKKEILISFEQKRITVIDKPDAKTQS
ncbi:cysteine-rich KTR domain-containing protein [Intestinimonas massiliensis (ex Afouda et al. 2020)]|uniref:cysteine-rich KTR domain-containing protein n=1 Tax=Intestinimonas massiliensis (ex Afouda et al. 2020) TaxID=1673721 RepID=UPI000B9C0495|nr:cysteine-rich KTR domain-containing protein [Intestinimonas massiliensis (ex Afouda et al. 2020)]